MPLASLELPARLRELIESGRRRAVASAELVVAGRVLYVDAQGVTRDGRDLGVVVVARDRTDLVSLTRRLGAVATMTDALRAQRHEFANRLHVVAGLIDAGRSADARAYLAELAARGPLKFPVEHADRLQEPYLQAVIGAAGEEASERGVRLIVGAETLVRGVVTEPEDVATVLGNLIDNAVRAAACASEPRWVEVDMLDEGDTLYITVADSGAGMKDATAAFDPALGAAEAYDRADSVHGAGFGLPLSRELARRRGGDLWVIHPGGSGQGAVLCARLPAVLEPVAGSMLADMVGRVPDMAGRWSGD